MPLNTNDCIKAVVITGASGFLGQVLVSTIQKSIPNAEIVRINSHRMGGIDLSHHDALPMLNRQLELSDPKNTVLIHTAANLKWNHSDAVLTNASMAMNLANWASSTGIGFNILVSTINVNPPIPKVDVATRVEPQTLYGVGKLTAEYIWRLILPDANRSIVRVSGIWGWQPHPTLFWNTLLLAATRSSQPNETLVVKRNRSLRNYISAEEASACLLTLAKRRHTGLFIAAGQDTVDMKTYVETIESLPGSKLSVDWQDDGLFDQQLYTPSSEFQQCLEPFPSVVEKLWRRKPKWVSETT